MAAVSTLKPFVPLVPFVPSLPFLPSTPFVPFLPSLPSFPFLIVPMVSPCSDGFAVANDIEAGFVFQFLGFAAVLDRFLVVHCDPFALRTDIHRRFGFQKCGAAFGRFVTVVRINGVYNGYVFFSVRDDVIAAGGNAKHNSSASDCGDQ